MAGNKSDTQENISVKLNFSMHTQQMDSWCWLAVGTSIALFYQKDSGWTQCQCLGACHPNLEDTCCHASAEDKAECDITGFLVDKKVEQGSFVTLGLVDKGDTNAYESGLFPFSTIRKYIDNGQILAVNIITNEKHEYPNGAMGTFSHFIAVIGYEIINGTEYVITADPMYLGEGGINENLMTYENLRSHYDLLTYPSSVAYSYRTINPVHQS